MNRARGVVIIGGGHNGLVTAFYLARAGFKPLVLEARPIVGGMAVTEELWPGYRCSTLTHVLGPVREEIVRDMSLERHGLRLAQSEVRLSALSPEGSRLTIYDDVGKTANEIGQRSQRDAAAYKEFQRVLTQISGLFRHVASNTPPEIDNPSKDDLIRGLRIGQLSRKLGRQNMYRLLRWAPMPVADLMDEWFEDPLLKAAVAARAVFGCNAGPHSPGTTQLLLLHCADDPHVIGPAAVPIGGTGALTQAMASAASEAGAVIRTNAEVAGIEVKEGRVLGVRLATGEEIATSAVVSNVDPVRTILGLIDPMHLSPSFLQRLQQYRCDGVVAKMNLALDGLPIVSAQPYGLNGSALSARFHIGPTMAYLERAYDASKYGEFSPAPYLEFTIPTVADPSLAPTGKHIMSVYAQYAPYQLRRGTWHTRKGELGESILRTLDPYVPDLRKRILYQQVITPADIESIYGTTRGHIFHGELTLEQFFAMRPLLGCSRYRLPVDGLYMCGSGTHPGSGLNGVSGANAAREIAKYLRKR